MLFHNADVVQLPDPPAQLPRPLSEATGKNGATMLPAQLPSSATMPSSASATVLFHSVDVEQLLHPQRESNAAAMLPSAQAFCLGGPSVDATHAITRNIASRDKQDIARRNATRSRRANAEHTARRVQELGDRAASSSADGSAKPTAAQRMQAMRDRVRARQAAQDQAP